MDQQQLIDMEVVTARSRLAQRLAALERRVVGATTDTVDTVRQASADIGSMIKETTAGVNATVSSVTSSVCETLDVPRQVRAHPWQSLGLAAAAGILAGLLPRTTRRNAPPAESPGVFQELWQTVRQEFTGIGQTLIASGAEAVKQTLTASTRVEPPSDDAGSDHTTVNAERTNGVCLNGRRF